MSNKFLNTLGGSLTDGSASIFIQSASLNGLDPNRPVRTNGQKTLVSGNINISEVTNLQSELNTKISNPITSELDFQGYGTTNQSYSEYSLENPLPVASANSLRVYANAIDGLMHTIDDLGNDIPIGGNVPPYVNSLVVNTLAQGTSALLTNYIFPINKPPEDGSTYAITNAVDAGGLFTTPSVNSTFQINLTTASNAIQLNFTFQANTTFPIDLILTTINERIAGWYESVFSPIQVVLSLNVGSFPYSTNISVSSPAGTAIVLNAGGTTNQVATFLGWPATSSPYTGNNIFTSPNTNTVTQIIELDNQLIWKKIPTALNDPTNKIESYDGSTSIICEDVGSIQSFGDVNYNSGNLTGVGSVSGVATCNITTNTTQIVNGSSEVKINVDTVDRLVIDDNKSALYSKNATTGPAGSLIELNNDNTFTLGCFAANNGIIECRPDSLAMYGNSANSSIILTGSNIITALSNGAGRIDREILDTTGQTFKDSTGAERLKVDSTGVIINNAYNMPLTGGTLAQVLTSDGASTPLWSTPQVYGLFSQTSIKTIVNTNVETSLIGTGVGSLSVPANYFQNGYSFLYKTGGIFRDSANGQLIRFRLRNSGVLFDSGILVLSNVNTLRGWNIECQFTYYGGNIITNFSFSYTDGNTDSFGFTNQGTNPINNTLPNVLDFTVTWTTANANNTISSNYGTLTKIF
jgi:hypothetical protein